MSKIIIDIDKTILSLHDRWIEYLVDRYGHWEFDVSRYQVDMENDLVDYNLANYFPQELFGDSRDKLDFWRQAWIYDGVELFEGAKEVIDELHYQGNVIMFVSFAKSGHLNGKWALLKGNFPWVVDSPSGGFIATKRKELVAADWIVDDRNNQLEPHDAKKLKYKSIYTQCTKLTKEHTLVKSWEEIGDILL